MKKKIAWYSFLFCVVGIIFFAVKFLLKNKHPKALKFLNEKSKKYKIRIEKINKDLEKLKRSKKNADDYKDTSINDDIDAIRRNIKTSKRRDKRIRSKKSR